MTELYDLSLYSADVTSRAMSKEQFFDDIIHWAGDTSNSHFTLVSEENLHL